MEDYTQKQKTKRHKHKRQNDTNAKHKIKDTKGLHWTNLTQK